MESSDTIELEPEHFAKLPQPWMPPPPSDIVENASEANEHTPNTLLQRPCRTGSLAQVLQQQRTWYRLPLENVGHIATTYGCLFCIVVSVNTFVLAYTACRLIPRASVGFQDVSTSVLVNLLLALVARNEHFVNILFKLACIKPTSAPFRVRAALSRIHNYGGLHSGCAIAATMWYLLQTVLVSTSFITGQVDAACITISLIGLFMLVSIVLFALPRIREGMHDHFETVHRFAGWFVVVLTWVQVVKFCSVRSSATGRSIRKLLVLSPALWLVTMITALTVYPWLRYRKRDVDAVWLSDHAIRLRFRGNAGSCTAVKLSTTPCGENHPFACIPEFGQHKSFSVIVSRAGDWTSKLIQAPPKTVWIRETPQRGVLWVARMFSPVVIVATGSGIGPCLGLFNGCPELPCRVLWSTRRPEATYGAEVMASVFRADPRAVIIDTDIHGRPDLSKEAEKLYHTCRAEAVVIISNRKLTYSVVQYLSQRGICSRGPIWDS